MKQILLTLVFVALFGGVAFGQPSRSAVSSVTITRGSGGSVKTPLSYDIAVNKDSSLTREWITVHDAESPLTLVDNIGVRTVYVRERSIGQYNYASSFSVQTKEPISAFEVRFLLFDLWGNHLSTLSMTEVSDVEGSKEFSGNWNVYSENEVSKYYAS